MPSFLAMLALTLVICLSGFSTEAWATSDVKFSGDVKGSEAAHPTGKTTCLVRVSRIIYDPNNTLVVGDAVDVLYSNPLGLEFNEDVEVFGRYSDVGPAEYVGYVVCLESPYYMVSTQASIDLLSSVAPIAMIIVTFIFLGLLLYWQKRQEMRRKQRIEEADAKERSISGEPADVNVISRISRVRASGEKPSINKFLGLPMDYSSCEVCAKISTPGVTQCIYCGRFVGVRNPLISGHEECWSSVYGCCKICADFIRKEMARSTKVESTPFAEEKQIQEIQKQNPFLDNALKSLANAIEFVGKESDRYRQAALIEMDAAVESLLKAKLFKDDPSDFMRSDWEHLTYEKAMEKVVRSIPIPESSLLKEAHSERNKAQHRAVIASSSWSQYHLGNIYAFAKRFCKEHFNLDLEQIYRLGFEPKKTEKIAPK
nr:hypothetical protein [Candidatus Njordarchaeum guaymaensis]